MKKIYCIEEWLADDERVRDGSFWGCLESPWKIGLTDRVQEFDDEEEFKDYLMNIINSCGIVGRVFTKEVPDDYKPEHFDESEIKEE